MAFEFDIFEIFGFLELKSLSAKFKYEYMERANQRAARAFGPGPLYTLLSKKEEKQCFKTRKNG